MRGSKWAGVAAACALVISVAACGGDDSGDAGGIDVEITDLRGKAGDGSYPEIEVATKDNEYIPKAVRIDPGVTVRWDNEGRSPHNILASDSTQDFGGDFGVQTEDFGPGAEYEFRFDDPGVYAYYCSLHGNAKAGMRGWVLVGDVSAETASAGGNAGKKGGTLEVPGDYETIQEAVDAAAPGAMVTIAPGTYRESVTVTTPNLVIRGLDRNRVVLDGGFELENGFKVLADGVAIENMTAQNYALNAFFWQGVKGFRGSYLTSYRTGDYGIYSFDSTDGQFDHSYAAGSADASYYVGQCYPCNVVLTDLVAEWSGLGYSGTNAGGDLYIVNSLWRNNRAGIVPNSGTGEANPPERETTVVGNTIYGNSNEQTPAISIAEIATGNGIIVTGGVANVIERNLIYDHDVAGIAIIMMPETLLREGDPDARNFDSIDNRVIGNVIRDSRAFDLALYPSLERPNETLGNCFSDNDFSTSSYPDIESFVPCDGPAGTGFTADLGRFAALLTAERPPPPDWKDAPLPPRPRLSGMPDVDGPPRPATGLPMRIDLDAIRVPRR